MAVNFLSKRWLGMCFLATWLIMSAPSLRAQSVPELPTGDGSGDTPDMFIKLIPGSAGPVAKRDESLRLSSLRGKVVLLDMFSSQCPHCIDHAPHVAEIYNQYRQRGFAVLGLATDNQDRAADVKAFMALTKLTYPVGFLTAEVIAYYMDNRNHGVPQMILFGPDGKMVKRLIGWTEKNGQELRATVEAQLARMPAAKTARPR